MHSLLKPKHFCWLLPLLVLSCSKQEEPVVEDPIEEVVEEVQAQEPANEEPAEEGNQTANEEPAEEAIDYSKRFWSSAMTEEERQASLARRIAASDEPYLIDMHDLGGWEFDERKDQPIPEYILALDGKMVTMRGFMMPDIDFEHIRTFHLVRSLYSCCFGAPPQLNEILRVTLRDPEGMDYTYQTVEVTGRLQVVFEMEDGLVEDLYRMEDVTYRLLEFDDPVAPDSFDADTGFDGVIPAPGSQF